jgi:cell fate (sporulation/competence/biofilm development) regulator YmcA (YheA/YmcA/DUF963 family)
MPRRKRSKKRRQALTPTEQFVAAIEEGLPPNPVVRQFDETELGTVDASPLATDSLGDDDTTEAG